jgi:hypothetical protein
MSDCFWQEMISLRREGCLGRGEKATGVLIPGFLDSQMPNSTGVFLLSIGFDARKKPSQEQNEWKAQLLGPSVERLPMTSRTSAFMFVHPAPRFFNIASPFSATTHSRLSMADSALDTNIHEPKAWPNPCKSITRAHNTKRGQGCSTLISFGSSWGGGQTLRRKQPIQPICIAFDASQ